MTVIQVRPQDVELHWKLALGFLFPAIEQTHGRHEPLDVLEDLQLGRSQLWAITEGNLLHGVAVSQIVIYSQMNALAVLYLGGVEYDRWGDQLIETLCEFAAAHECQRLELYGRKGWERKLPGWRLMGIWLERDVEVSDGRQRPDAEVRPAGIEDRTAPVAG